MSTKHAILKVRDRDGESRYVVAVLVKDGKGGTKQDIGREDMLRLCQKFKLSEEEMSAALDRADKRFEESRAAEFDQASAETNDDISDLSD